MTQTPKIMTLKECFTDFVERFPSALRSSREARSAFAVFTGANLQSTVGPWLIGKSFPAGVMLWKAIVFFQWSGYSVSEYQTLSNTNKKLAELFGSGLFEIRDIAAQIGYTNQVPEKGLLRILRENRLAHNTVQEKLDAFIAEYAADLQMQRDAFVNTHQLILVNQSSTKSTKTAAVVPMVPEKPLASIETDTLLLETAAKMLLALVPVLEQLTSSKTTPATRQQFRQLAGGKVVFNASNALTSLCGEKSHELNTQQKGTTNA